MYQVINNLPIDYDFQSKTKEELKLYAKWFEENKESRTARAYKSSKNYKRLWKQGGRPKRPNFKLHKTPFKETNLLVFNKSYLGKKTTSFALKFYSDGRLIFFTSQDGFTIKPSDTFNKNWENAPNIG